MTREDIIRMTRESGMTFILGQPHEKVVEQLVRFAALVEAAEREACAVLCDALEADALRLYWGRPPYTGREVGHRAASTQGEIQGAGLCAGGIRARGTT